ncbi:MAG: hypothetical protein MJ252_07125, partial [archaeon]|nr:hypothetical protein [archaeon]
MANFDLYARPVNFSFRGYSLVPSYCGGFISLIIECLLIAYLVFLILDMLDRKNPLLSAGASIKNFPDEAKINAAATSLTDFKSKKEYNLLSFFCVFNGSQCIESDYFDIVIEQKEETDGIILTKNLEMTNFEPGKFKANWANKDVVEDTVSGSHLIKDPYYLSKSYGMSGAKWIELKVRYKEGINPSNFKNSSFQFECWQEKIGILYSEYKDDMIVSYLENIYWNILPNNTKVATYPLSRKTSYVNDYYLPRFLVPKSKRHVLVSSGMEDQTKAFDGQNLVIFRFFLSREVGEVERNFQDVLTIISVIGGLAGAAITILIVLVFVIRDFRLNEKAMKDCYYILDPHQKVFSFEEYIEKLFKKIGNKGTFIPKEKETEMINLKKESEKEGGVSYDPSLDIEGNDSNDSTPLTRFFNLRRIKDIFTFDQNGKIIKPEDKEKRLKYLIAKIIYVAAYIKSDTDYGFNCCGIMAYFLFNCCCCSRKRRLYHYRFNTKRTFLRKYKRYIEKTQKEEENIKGSENEGFQSTPSESSVELIETKEIKQIEYRKNKFSNLEKKYAIYRAGGSRIGTDFDILDILTKIYHFNCFTKVVFKKYQNNLFNLFSKPVISEENANDKKEYDDEEDKQYADLVNLNRSLYKLTKKGEIKDCHLKLLELVGLPVKDIEELLLLIKDINGDNSLDGVSWIANLKSKKSENTTNFNDKEEVIQEEQILEEGKRMSSAKEGAASIEED